ncbi:alpha/beta fold hydrolase [Rhodococcus globerulus]|uniref:alpha/beta fold hydrolase n=1 Tax=Rhodococcus globerulus TaxID=33008 RepID=UPI000AC0F9B0|nr:alpha/beta fold hydrolase [Rhodococcus globerulus]
MLDTRRLITSARNAWGLSFGDGIEGRRRTPSTLISEGPHRDLYRFGEIQGRPVLLVPPLAVPAYCYDLRPGQSLASHLVRGGHTPYALDYGTMQYTDRHMGFESWIDGIIPDAIRAVSELHDGTDVSVIGWSLGGTMTLLTASAHSDLPIASITAIGTPVDYTKIPTISPLRLIGGYTGDRPLTTATDLIGGLPAPLVQASYRVTAPQRELLKPWFIAKNLHNTETLARMESIDTFMADMPGYPGRAFRQICRQLILGNGLYKNTIVLGGRSIDLSELNVPVLAIGGTSDVIAPAASVAAIRSVLTGSPSVRFEEVPGSHLGIVAGPTSENSTWARIDSFLKDVTQQMVTAL